MLFGMVVKLMAVPTRLDAGTMEPSGTGELMNSLIAVTEPRVPVQVSA